MASRLQRTDLKMQQKLLRYGWSIAWALLCRPTPRFLHGWRCLVLRLFGATIQTPAYIYPSARIWAPWNLSMQPGSTIAEEVDLYCVDQIEIGENSTISQYSFICTASHDYRDPDILDRPEMPLTTAPIKIGSYVWVAADAFIAPGLELGDGVVVLARSSVYQDVEPWTVVAGNPATPVRKRELKDG